MRDLDNYSQKMLKSIETLLNSSEIVKSNNLVKPNPHKNSTNSNGEMES